MDRKQYMIERLAATIQTKRITASCEGGKVHLDLTYKGRVVKRSINYGNVVWAIKRLDSLVGKEILEIMAAQGYYAGLQRKGWGVSIRVTTWSVSPFQTPSVVAMYENLARTIVINAPEPMFGNGSLSDILGELPKPKKAFGYRPPQPQKRNIKHLRRL
jgi:hypothetical protein